MDSAQSVVTIAATLLTAGAVAFGVSKYTSTGTSSLGTTDTSNTKSKRKRKTKAAKESVVPDQVPAEVPKATAATVPAKKAIPGGFESEEETGSVEETVKIKANSKKAKKKKPAATKTTVVDSIPTPASALPHNVSEDEKRAKSTLSSSAASSNVGRKPLAERLLPKARKTAVDDMLEKSDVPAIARVMRVGSAPAPAVPIEEPEESSSSEEDEQRETEQSSYRAADFEDVSSSIVDDDAGWGVVKGKGKKPTTTSSFSSHASHAPSSSSNAPLTKRQRQNAAKRDSQKASKAQSEAERLAVLARHKRQLEQERIAEFYKKESGKVKSGGMNAVVGEGGRVSWE